VTLPAYARPLDADASKHPEVLPSLVKLLYRYRNTEAVRDHLPSLHPLAWAVFARIAAYMMWGRASAHPSQARLAQEIGWSERAIRKHSRELFEKGVLVATKVVRAQFGGYRYVYEPGPAFIAALEARWRADMGRRRAKPLGGSRRKGAPFGPENDPVPEMPLPEETSPVAPMPTEETSDAQEAAAITAALADEPEDVRVARAALAYVSEKKHGCIRPGALRVADANQLALVGSRVAMLAVEGEAAKLELMRAAVDAAFARSKHGSPSLRYIFANPEHFAEHARKGLENLEAARREEAERAAREARKAAKAARMDAPKATTVLQHSPATPDRAALSDAKTFAELALASLGELSDAPAPRPVVVRVRRIE
jgi:biotin operon repressor